MGIRKRLLKITSGFIAGAFLAIPALASAATLVVRSDNTQGWSTADTRPGGAVNFIVDASAPAGLGALQLTTDATNTAKAQYLHAANSSLASVTELGYYTKQTSAPLPDAAPSYQIPVYLNGTPASFTTLVYEPYQNGTVTPGVWQQWDVDAGQFWSTRTFADGTCSVSAGGGGAPFYTLAQLKTMCPNAAVLGYGVNIGTNNPSYNVSTDLFNFNGTIYDFEPIVGPPTSLDECRNNGYKQFNNPAFKNTSQCLKYVRSHGSPEEIEGTLRMSNPNQKIEFDVDVDNETPGEGNKGSVKYWNYNYPGGLRYEADVLCVGGDKANNEARVMFQIPAGYPGLSGMYVVAYVKDSTGRGVKDLYGHAATVDRATAIAWCQTGAGYAPTMYTVTRSDDFEIE